MSNMLHNNIMSNIEQDMMAADLLIKKVKKLSNYSWDNKDILNFDCHWGELLLQLYNDNQNIKSLTGIDKISYWDNLDTTNKFIRNIFDNKIKLISGNIILDDKFQDIQFDTIISSKSLHCFSANHLEKIMDLFYKYLRPGGDIFINVKTFFTKNINTLKINTPYAHLLFPQHEIIKYLNNKDIESILPFTGSTFINLLRQAGFNIKAVERDKVSDSSEFLKKHASKLRVYNKQEFETAEILINGVKPDNEIDLEKHFIGEKC